MVNALRALSDPIRLRIVHLLLAQPELCVCQLSAVLQVNYPALSKHLQMLKLVGIVSDEKRGRWIYYRLNRESWNPAVERLIQCVADLGAIESDIFRQDQKGAGRVACCSLADVARLGPAFLKSKAIQSSIRGAHANK